MTETVSWKTAKTYSDAPHEYILANDYPETYQRFSKLLKETGVMESFTLRGKTAKYRDTRADVAVTTRS